MLADENGLFRGQRIGLRFGWHTKGQQSEPIGYPGDGFCRCRSIYFHGLTRNGAMAHFGVCSQILGDVSTGLICAGERDRPGSVRIRTTASYFRLTQCPCSHGVSTLTIDVEPLPGCVRRFMK